MKQHYISKLFYNKYPYKIIVEIRPNQNKSFTWNKIKTWLVKNAVGYKTYTTIMYSAFDWLHRPRRLYDQRVSIFLKTETEFEACKKRFKGRIKETYSPYDNNHIDLLKDNIHISIRKNLIYKKYRYAISFKYDYETKNTDVKEWVLDNLKSSLDDETIKWYYLNGTARMYLLDDTNLVLIKLTWLDRIGTIRTVRTFNEVETNNNENP